MLDAGSIAPVSLSASADDDDLLLNVRDVEEPLPLVSKRPPQARPAPADQVTHPSQRVVAQRRHSRGRAAAFAALGGAAIALAAWPFTGSMTLPPMATMAPAEVSITSAPISAAFPAAIPTTKPTLLPDAPAATEVSFAASSAESSTPTPLAVTPTPLATSEELPPPPTLPFPSPDAPSEAAAPAQPPPVKLPAPRAVTPASLPNAPVAVASPRVRPSPATPARATAAATGQHADAFAAGPSDLARREDGRDVSPQALLRPQVARAQASRA